MDDNIYRDAKAHDQVEDALLILKRRKAALGWKMSNIHGIILALCMHNIYMEEG